MAYCNKRLILASGSPRRRELLDKFGINYEILPAQGEESAPPELTPGERVKALAAQKAEEVAQRLNDPAAVILAADTLVELDGEVLGKPGTAERAQAMLREMARQEACHAKQFGAVYFLKTGKKACPGRPDAPCVTCINETLRQRYSEEHAAHEAYEALAENAGTHRCMLLKIAEEECGHAQMILCILQTCL